MTDQDSQLDLPFESPFNVGDNPALWAPRDIWVRLTQQALAYFPEDKRLEYKRGNTIHFDDLAKYFSAFSNTPDGGVIIIGANSKGEVTGCNTLSMKQINKIDRFHVEMCPRSKPEVKRISATVGDLEVFL